MGEIRDIKLKINSQLMPDFLLLKACSSIFLAEQHSDNIYFALRIFISSHIVYNNVSKCRFNPKICNYTCKYTKKALKMQKNVLKMIICT